jgi:hypothetical protein
MPDFGALTPEYLHPAIQRAQIAFRRVVVTHFAAFRISPSVVLSALLGCARASAFN